VKLTPYITRMNAENLLAAATHRSKREIDRFIADRFPSSEELGLVERLVPGSVAPLEVPVSSESTEQLGPEPVAQAEALAPQTERGFPSAQRVAPIAPGRSSFHFSGPQCLEEKYEQFRALRSHAAPDADMAATFEAALDIGIAELERRKFAAVERPRRGARASDNPRYIPAAVRRAVRKRDGGRCTFVSDDGHRCGSRRRLEYDHIEPAARGGAATVENLRLRCRAHNQFEAERVFGREFIKLKRQRAAAG
jgi:hypothetical protein